MKLFRKGTRPKPSVSLLRPRSKIFKLSTRNSMFSKSFMPVALPCDLKKALNMKAICLLTLMSRARNERNDGTEKNCIEKQIVAAGREDVGERKFCCASKMCCAHVRIYTSRPEDQVCLLVWSAALHNVEMKCLLNWMTIYP